METETTPTSPPEKKSNLLKPLLILGGLVALILVIKYIMDSVSLASSCYGQSKSYVDELVPIYDDWTAKVNSAEGVSRKAISRVILDLEDIRKDAIKIEFPPCARAAHTELIAAMDGVLEAFNAYHDNASKSDVADKMDDSSAHLHNFTNALDTILETKP